MISYALGRKLYDWPNHKETRGLPYGEHPSKASTISSFHGIRAVYNGGINGASKDICFFGCAEGCLESTPLLWNSKAQGVHSHITDGYAIVIYVNRTYAFQRPALH